MIPAQTYRMYATVAAEMAADTTDPDKRASLLKVAQAFRGLADEEEGGSVLTLLGRADEVIE